MSAVACFYYKFTTDRWLDLQDECQLLEFVMVGGASNLVSVVLVMFIHQCRSFFEKTYDKINWDFLISCLRQRGFHNHSSA